jgi:putative SOS response-associated peptidase YedK
MGRGGQKRTQHARVIAMPVILRTTEEIDRWMCAPAEDVVKLQQPLPDGTLRIVAKGPRED